MISALRTALAAATLVAGVLAIACSSGGGPATPAGTGVLQGTQQSSTPEATPAASPEEALGRYVQRVLSQGFLADCAKEKRPDDVGKQCAHFRGKRGDLLAYELGPTFSDPTRVLILKPENGDWTLLRIQNVGTSAAPGIPWPVVAGAQLVVAGTAPACLAIHAAPGTGSPRTDCIGDGTAVTAVAGPMQQDDIEWWQLEGLGWAAGDYLRYPDQAPAATPTPNAQGQ